MKINRLNIAAFLLVAFVGGFYSCKKEKEQNPVDPKKQEEALVAAAKDELLGSTILGSSDKFFELNWDQYANVQNRGCVEVTYSGIGYPKTLEVDYGDDGCELPNGKILAKGKVTLTLSDWILNDKAEKEVVFDKYELLENKLNGFYKTKLHHENANGKPEYDIASDFDAETKEGKKYHKDFKGKMEWIEGHKTKLNILDDEFLYTVSGTVKMDNGMVVSRKTVKPIHRKVICRHPVAGIVSFEVGPMKMTIDYGDGTCDDKAILTDVNGQDKEIDLDEWWKFL